MATIFDILKTLNNNNNNINNNKIESCKRQYTVNKRIDIIPSMDVTMTNDKLIIETELPGVSKNDIDINIKDSILIIQGEKKNNIIKLQQQQQQQSEKSSQSTNNKDDDEPSIEEYEDDTKLKSNLNKNTENKDENKTTSSITNKKFISERSFGNFKRYLNLSEILYQLDLNSINTQFENGLLTITINKKSDNFQIKLKSI
ncbi:heat shock protein Hsp20 domain-containing protein [Dictyostelium discoideum AX4]|uniref:Small heat shock protein hspG2 n=1 Tax=Dictyostelium discoideum TaxID=44689 RepID=HSPG2_DICDI|nr:heat shock protein Hsp20 domain-containing protein [Dictyostelium discoideum AX4]Q552K9.1 RecName: Full=Small heat shock protein hspG2 [Dictyostelium discoideum]EAL69458.1 heat shock protein Hsp20 domain-containing protein [Dictyostelium discoideum AX4]|eukprot:XP_643373.1 heat shock protein Hsp20 domain-containing protein [Dictyostelium discoideum AX4]